jgi:hypothetical protein
MIRAAWGLPQTINSQIAPDGTTDRYMYVGYVVVLENNRVILIRKRQQPNDDAGHPLPRARPR